MNENPKPNHIPTPRILAKRFAAGKVVEYPADLIFSAVNSQWGYLKFNSVAIPIQKSFAEIFWRDISLLIYLSKHNLDYTGAKSFIENPYRFTYRWKSVRLPEVLTNVVAEFMIAISKPPLYEMVNGSTTKLLEYLAQNDVYGLCRIQPPEHHFVNFSGQMAYYRMEHNIDPIALGLGPDFETNIVLLVKAIYG